MKSKWKVFLLSTLFLLLVAGCSNASNASNEESGDQITLKFHHWYTEEAGNWDEVIATYEAEHPEVNIESIPLVENLNPADYMKKLDLLASSGEQLDVFIFANDRELMQRVQAGLVAPLDSFIEKENLNIQEEYSSPSYEIDGSYYGLPGKRSSRLVLLNKDHLDEVGLPVPTDWTWDEYKDYAKKLTKGEGASKRYGSYFHTSLGIYDVPKLMGKSENISILNKDGSSNMDDPLIEEGLKLRYDMEQVDGSSVPLAEILSQKLDYRQQFFSESVSMVPTGSYMITEWGAFTPEMNMAWAPWPKNKKDDINHNYTGSDIFGIAKNSEYKEEAYQFIRWMTTEGMIVQGKNLPSWNKANLTEVVEDLVSDTINPEAVDLESLLYTLENSLPSEVNVPKPYITEAQEAYYAEVELYLLGEQDLETTLSNAKEKVQAIINANQ
ncbi:hypothetical protein CWR48_02800 [Oceanobacillus arenosus]|uniref:ABC transporter substrate-binding protein n=1 Tax=Oceanobacillus arenosus TaxID=1229153 RepID=A0A3D8Q2Q5_9BACI|nr:extracellular solute-binding protein [Oceanobacillus arenosus]RDW21355.1 hypothetical protein CWR48_02800 [Oceanobacillus arenosus]